MKKFMSILSALLVILFITTLSANACFFRHNKCGMLNPWSDCEQNTQQASKIAGFEFPLILSNYSIRAMKGLYEINYPLDEKRNVCVRKTISNKFGEDTSGDYNKYPINTKLKLDGDVELNVRRDNDKIYVMYFAAESGYYSARCEYGMSEEEVKGIFNVIKEAEEAKLPPEAFNE